MAKLSQKDLQKLYTKERKNLMARITRLEKAGVTVEVDLQRPKIVKPADIAFLRSLQQERLLKGVKTKQATVKSFVPANVKQLSTGKVISTQETRQVYQKHKVETKLRNEILKTYGEEALDYYDNSISRTGIKNLNDFRYQYEGYKGAYSSIDDYSDSYEDYSDEDIPDYGYSYGEGMLQVEDDLQEERRYIYEVTGDFEAVEDFTKSDYKSADKYLREVYFNQPTDINSEDFVKDVLEEAANSDKPLYYRDINTGEIYDEKAEYAIYTLNKKGMPSGNLKPNIAPVYGYPMSKEEYEELSITLIKNRFKSFKAEQTDFFLGRIDEMKEKYGAWAVRQAFEDASRDGYDIDWQDFYLGNSATRITTKLLIIESYIQGSEVSYSDAIKSYGKIADEESYNDLSDYF